MNCVEEVYESKKKKKCFARGKTKRIVLGATMKAWGHNEGAFREDKKGKQKKKKKKEGKMERFGSRNGSGARLILV